MSRKIFWLILILTLVWVGGDVRSAHGQADEAVVKAVFFYSPTCPYCHIVMDEIFPPLQAQYGEQLQIVYVNVQEPSGANLMREACSIYNPPSCGSVPALAVADSYLIGASAIPEQFPTIIEQGLAAGGIAFPRLTGIEQLAPSTAAPEKLNIWEKFENDAFANSLAVVVLALLIFSVGWLGYQAYQGLSKAKPNLNRRLDWPLLFLSGILGLFVAATLVLEMESFTLVSVLALAAAAMMTLFLLLLGTNRPKPLGENWTLPRWVFPALIVLGVFVAGYLAYIEMSETEAVCGAVGNCNLVQQSEYAKLLGVLPIGVLGLFGYGLIFGAWALSQTKHNASEGQALLFGLTLFGALFSIYLTFLEPFVIGATCAWCLTSAILLLMLLWLQAPQGLEALHQTFGKSAIPQPSAKKRRRVKHS